MEAPKSRELAGCCVCKRERRIEEEERQAVINLKSTLTYEIEPQYIRALTLSLERYGDTTSVCWNSLNAWQDVFPYPKLTLEKPKPQYALQRVPSATLHTRERRLKLLALATSYSLRNENDPILMGASAYQSQSLIDAAASSNDSLNKEMSVQLFENAKAEIEQLTSDGNQGAGQSDSANNTSEDGRKAFPPILMRLHRPSVGESRIVSTPKQPSNAEENRAMSAHVRLPNIATLFMSQTIFKQITNTVTFVTKICPNSHRARASLANRQDQEDEYRKARRQSSKAGSNSSSQDSYESRKPNKRYFLSISSAMRQNLSEVRQSKARLDVPTVLGTRFGKNLSLKYRN